jgi:hypothetical protein
MNLLGYSETGTGASERFRHHDLAWCHLAVGPRVPCEGMGETASNLDHDSLTELEIVLLVEAPDVVISAAAHQLGRVTQAGPPVGEAEPGCVQKEATV